jgi:hypothetical protein
MFLESLRVFIRGLQITKEVLCFVFPPKPDFGEEVGDVEGQ